MTFLILHGIGGYAGIHWQQWLHDNLVRKDYQVIIPNLPNPNQPERAEWLSSVKKLVSEIDLADLVIIGHSLGVTTALDFIEEVKSPIKALISVAGFAKDYGLELNSYFLKEREIDFDKVKKNLKQAFVIYGNNDPYVPQDVLYSLARKLEVVPKIIKNGGYLNTESGYTTFPYLFAVIEEKIEKESDMLP